MQCDSMEGHIYTTFLIKRGVQFLGGDYMPMGESASGGSCRGVPWMERTPKPISDSFAAYKGSHCCQMPVNGGSNNSATV